MFSRFYREECWISCCCATFGRGVSQSHQSANVELTPASNGEGVHVEPPGLYRLGWRIWV